MLTPTAQTRHVLSVAELRLEVATPAAEVASAGPASALGTKSSAAAADATSTGRRTGVRAGRARRRAP
jgi:hypothetical protein